MWNFIRRSFLPAAISVILISPSSSEEGERGFMPENLSLSFNGRFIHESYCADSKANSENGRFWCRYQIGRVGDELRELKKFEFFENERLLYAMEQAPGSDLYISNSGVTAFMDNIHHYKNEITVHLYSRDGEYLFSESFAGAILFGFSTAGNKFGVGTTRGLYIISIPDHKIEEYEKGFQFDISEEENLVAVASENRAAVYSDNGLLREIETDFAHTRKIRISSDYDIVVVIDKRHLKAYSISNGDLLFSDTLTGNLSYRDVILENGKILAGIHYRDDESSRGILKIYNLRGEIILEKEESVKDIRTPGKPEGSQKSTLDYDEIPWPFAPFDSVCTVWNYYEQHMSYGEPDWSYLHQGLDIITPIGEPVYAVEDGFVKCILTISGAQHWRIAISPEQTADYSDGWLYAHLIENTIQFDVGDTVEIYDYLGDIIYWTSEWGHIHFVQIRDSGWVWRYDDGEWGINYNPLLSLQPDTDPIPPVIEDVFEYSKFGFCTNETSTYLDPDSLYGDIDIIVKVVDYVGDSPWQQPAYETYYWVESIPDGDTVFPRTLGQILNHSYDFYGSGYYEPYATTIYKRDWLLLPPFWMDMERDYFHILTNNNGDSLIELSEKQLAFSTTDYPDGEYRIFVEALDEYGNSIIDSMDVRFQNGIVGNSDGPGSEPDNFQLSQCYPNPFNQTTNITYSIPEADFVSLEIFDLLGREIQVPVSQFQQAGRHSVTFDAGGLSSGIYFYRLQTGNIAETRKLLLLR